MGAADGRTTTAPRGAVGRAGRSVATGETLGRLTTLMAASLSARRWSTGFDREHDVVGAQPTHARASLGQPLEAGDRAEERRRREIGSQTELGEVNWPRP